MSLFLYLLLYISKKSSTFARIINFNSTPIMQYPVKYSESAVQEAIDKVFEQLPVLTDNTIFLVLMNGAVWFAHELIKRYGTTPVKVYYAKVSSYEGKERGELEITYMPKIQFEGADVIVLDDICDSGTTVNTIYDYLLEHKAQSVRFATLVKRANAALLPHIELTSGIHDASGDFFVGCGLDDNDNARNLPYIGIC